MYRMEFCGLSGYTQMLVFNKIEKTFREMLPLMCAVQREWRGEGLSDDSNLSDL